MPPRLNIDTECLTHSALVLPRLRETRILRRRCSDVRGGCLTLL